MTDSQNPPVRLPILVNLTTDQRTMLSGPSVTVGRAPDNFLVLENDEYVSGDHARIFWDNGIWWLEDLMSSNGTFVNDQLLQGPWQLSPQDIIKIGRTTFRIE